VDDRTIGLGWRFHASTAVVMAVRGPAASPVVVHREEVVLLEDESLREPYHGAAGAGLPVTTIAATGTLLDDASQVLGVELAPVLAALGTSIGPPWQKQHKEATAVALLALHALA
jgi:hypothetical protein